MRMMAWTLLPFVFAFCFGIYTTARTDRLWAHAKQVEGKVIGHQINSNKYSVQFSYADPFTQEEKTFSDRIQGTKESVKAKYIVGNSQSIWVNDRGQARATDTRPDSSHLWEIILITLMFALICGTLFWFSRDKS